MRKFRKFQVAGKLPGILLGSSQSLLLLWWVRVITLVLRVNSNSSEGRGQENTRARPGGYRLELRSPRVSSTSREYFLRFLCLSPEIDTTRHLVYSFHPWGLVDHFQVWIYDIPPQSNWTTGENKGHQQGQKFFQLQKFYFTAFKAWTYSLDFIFSRAIFFLETFLISTSSSPRGTTSSRSDKIISMWHGELI